MKIEFDLPEFNKEISINVIIRKDGEVVCSASSSSDNTRPKELPNLIVDDNDKVIPQAKQEFKGPETPFIQPTQEPKKSLGGNFMDPSLFN